MRMLITWCLAIVVSAAFCFVCSDADGSEREEQPQTEDRSSRRELWQAFVERIERAHSEPLGETADQTLIRKKDARWPRYLRAFVKAPTWLDLGVDHRTRYEHMTNPFRKGESGTDRQFPLHTRVRVGLNGGPLRLLVEFQDARTHNAGGADFVNNKVVNKRDILQLFASATSVNVLETGLRADLQIGRLTLDIGSRRLIARNDFRNTTNTFDGAHVSFTRQDDWRLRAFLVSSVSRLESDPDPAGPANDNLFWGVHWENQEIPWLKHEVYYLGLNDKPASVSEQRQYSTFGLRLYQSPKHAQFDYEGETVWQVGTKGTTAGDKDHFAHFQHAEIGYTFGITWKPRLVAQYDYASGTSNPNGSDHETFDTLFGARRFEYVPTGTFGPFFRSNMSSPGWRLILRPAPPLTLTLKHRAWYLAQSKDEWTGSGLQDPSGGSGNFLGQDVEVRVQWKPSANLCFDMGYDHFFKGSYIDNLAEVPGNPPDDDTDYFYMSTNIRF